MNEPMPESPVAENGSGMTTEELDAIAATVRALMVDDPTRPARTRNAAKRLTQQSEFAKSAVHRFNLQVEVQRLLLERARAKHDAGERVPADLQVELRAAAVLYSVERDRIVRSCGLRLGAGNRLSLAV
jgi:hypothetical protein